MLISGSLSVNPHSLGVTFLLENKTLCFPEKGNMLREWFGFLNTKYL